MAIERTLSIIKPDGVEKGVIGKIITRFVQNGLKPVAMRMAHLSKREAGITVVEGPHLLGKAMKDVLSKPRPKAKAPAVAASPAASKRASGPAKPVKKAKAGRA